MPTNYPTSLFSSNLKFASENQYGGALSIAGCTAEKLVKEYGSPIFVVDQDDFVIRTNAWQAALNESFGSGKIYYAAKSFICVEVAKWLKELKVGLDVCTGGELAVALAADFPASDIEFHGNNKSEAEITTAIKEGVGTIVIDSFDELSRVAKIATEFKKIQKVYLRLTPGIDAHTHEFISTAHEDVKFGFSIASGDAQIAIDKCMVESSLNLAGIHCHIGSQIFEVSGFELAAQRLVAVLVAFRDKYSKELAELNLGGGYGIAYTKNESAISPAQVIPAIAKVIKSECEKAKLSVPKISIEPGRAIVGPTTTTIYMVGTTKSVTLENGAKRRYISVDGGMSENIRPALYGATYSAFLANRNSSAMAINSRIVGKHCESGDILISEIDMPEDVKAGDLLAIPATGAYGRSMASNYNHMPRPSVIAVINGTAREILRRENEDDLLNLDVIQAPRQLS
ncbi:MAG: diaminopimelate decarboxylase [actinobacterium acIB-AMD-7]|jgi:diaminopimelate decarboxylase|nr:MAG: diaminopimelate decarboxylase [actinobacterium acIB-AMD-7]